MDCVIKELKEVFHLGDILKNGDVTAFNNEIDNNRPRKQTILTHLALIVSNTDIPIVPILKKYKISLNEAEKYRPKRSFLRSVCALRIKEFSAVIDHFKDDGYKTLRTIVNYDECGWEITQFCFGRAELFQVARKCSRKGNLKLLTWIIEHTKMAVGEMFNNSIFHFAVANNRLNTLKYLVDRYAINKSDALYNFHGTLAMAAQYGYVGQLKWLVRQFNVNYNDITAHNNRVLRWSIEEGHLPVIQWLEEEFGITYKNATMAHSLAKKHKRTDICNWLNEKFDIEVAAKVPLIENFKKSFPNYIIARPEELIEYISAHLK